MKKLLLAGVLLLAGCGWTNPSTPAGSAGYVTEEPIWFGHRHYVTTQIGPYSPGLVWREYVTNVSITPFTATEPFTGDASVLSRDNLKLQFEAHLIFKIDPKMLQQFIEKYAQQANGTDYVGPAYGGYIQQPFRMIARDEVQKYNGLDVKDQIDPIGTAITTRLRQYLQGSPFIVMQAVVGNIQYPATVADAVSQKIAAAQILARKRVEIDQTKMDAEKRVAEAQGIAQSMNVINNELTPIYLQHEAIQAQREMVAGPNHTEIFIPTGPMGVPIVGTMPLNAPVPDTKKGG